MEVLGYVESFTATGTQRHDSRDQAQLHVTLLYRTQTWVTRPSRV